MVCNDFESSKKINSNNNIVFDKISVLPLTQSLLSQSTNIYLS